VEETAHSCSANRTLVCLHPHNLRAVDAQAHVSAGQHHGIFVGCIADDAFFLAFIDEISRKVVDAVNVIEVHNLIVVQKLLF
jgi:hypothetical protein